jgi:hypothetical protein
MLRVAGSLITHQVRTYDLLGILGREGHPTPLGQAFAEYGRSTHRGLAWTHWYQYPRSGRVRRSVRYGVDPLARSRSGCRRERAGVGPAR